MNVCLGSYKAIEWTKRLIVPYKIMVEMVKLANKNKPALFKKFCCSCYMRLGGSNKKKMFGKPVLLIVIRELISPK